MPPKRAAARKSAPTQTGPRDQESEVELQESEGYDDLRQQEERLMSSMAVGVSQRNKLRKGERQRQIEDAFENQVRELEERIDERVEEYQQENKRQQEAFVSRLLALTQKKAEVEKQIVQHVQELAEAYELVKVDFQAVLNGRFEDVHEAITTLNELQGQGGQIPGVH